VGRRPPARPLRALHVVSWVRAVVGEGVVERSCDGYRLELPEAEVDVRDLAGRAQRGGVCAAFRCCGRSPDEAAYGVALGHDVVS